MPDTERDPMDDYNERMAQHELAKQEGTAAYADAIIKVLGVEDEEKAILIKEGLKAVLGGPPNLSFPPLLHFPPPQVDAEFAPPPSPYFVQQDEYGNETAYDWMAIAGAGTHAHRDKSGEHVAIMYGKDAVLHLKGIAATKYWEWQQFYIENNTRAMSGMPVVIRGRR